MLRCDALCLNIAPKRETNYNKIKDFKMIKTVPLYVDEFNDRQFVDIRNDEGRLLFSALYTISYSRFNYWTPVVATSEKFDSIYFHLDLLLPNELYEVLYPEIPTKITELREEIEQYLNKKSALTSYAFIESKIRFFTNYLQSLEGFERMYYTDEFLTNNSLIGVLDTDRIMSYLKDPLQDDFFIDFLENYHGISEKDYFSMDEASRAHAWLAIYYEINFSELSLQMTEIEKEAIAGIIPEFSLKKRWFLQKNWDKFEKAKVYRQDNDILVCLIDKNAKLWGLMK